VTELEKQRKRTRPAADFQGFVRRTVFCLPIQENSGYNGRNGSAGSGAGKRPGTVSGETAYQRGGERMFRYFFIYLGIINLIAFGLFAADKKRAVYNGEIEKAKRRRKPEPVRAMKRRIPEKTLFVAAAIGGSIGAMAGMWLLRHKTRHWYFVYGMPAILLLQLLIAWIAVRGI
jgi:uncharacterized membrane protein YsdA (DUF1294 family)